MPGIFPYDFFTPAPEMLSGPGFVIFGPEHLAWICFAVILVFAVIRGYGRLPGGTERGSRRRKMMLVVAVIPLILLVSQDAIMASAGVFGVQWWPLHSCNVCEYLALLYALRPNRPTGEILLTLGTAGAACAILFPGWTYCPPLTFPVVCGFVEHALIMAFILMLVLGGDFRPRFSELWESVAFTSALAFAAYLFDKANDTNFLFVNTPAEGSPLVGWYQAFGSPGYIIPYAAVALIVFTCLQGLFCLIARHAGNRAARSGGAGAEPGQNPLSS